MNKSPRFFLSLILLALFISRTALPYEEKFEEDDGGGKHADNGGGSGGGGGNQDGGGNGGGAGPAAGNGAGDPGAGAAAAADRSAGGGGGGGDGSGEGGGGLDAQSAAYNACLRAKCPTQESICQEQCTWEVQNGVVGDVSWKDAPIGPSDKSIVFDDGKGK